MYKNKIILCGFITCSLTVFSQQKSAKIEFSKSITIENAKTYEADLTQMRANRLFYSTESNFFTVDVNLKKYDLDFKQIESTPISNYISDGDMIFTNNFHRLGQKENTFLFHGLIPQKDKFVLTSNITDKKSDKTSFYRSDISFQSILKNENKKILFDRNFTKAKYIVADGNYHYNNAISNADKSFYLFYELGDNKGLNISADLFDGELNSKLKIEKLFTEINGTAKIQDIFLATDGTLLIGVTNYEGLKLPSKKYDHYLVIIKEAESSIIKIGQSTNHITEFKISESNGAFFILGLTSNSSYTDYDVTGTYFSKVNIQSKKIEDEIYNNLPLDFISLYNGKSKEIGSCNLIKSLVINDEFYLIGEQKKTKSAGSGGPSNAAFTDHYIEDIIICKLNNKGISEWNRKIDKTQERILSSNSGNLMEMSFSVEYINNSLVFIYADDKSNITSEYSETGSNFNSKDLDYISNGYTGYVVCATVIDSKGEVSITKIEQDQLNKFRFLPYNTYKKDENSIILYFDNVDTKVTSKTEFKFAKLSLK